MKDNVNIVIMAGGVGNRLAPLSTPEMPKQFLNLYGSHSLLQHTVNRFLFGGYQDRDIFVITAKEYVEKAVEHTEPLLGTPYQVLFEPERKGTLHCIAYSLSLVPPSIRSDKTQDPVIAFVPADHFIRDRKNFIHNFELATMMADAGDGIVLLAARPEYPESGFGYMHIDVSGIDVDGFVEKPENPEHYIKQGYVWNTGIFVAKRSTFLKAIEEANPQAHVLTQYKPHDPMRAVEGFYSLLDSKSFDREVLERYQNVQAVVGNFGWNDLGDYQRYQKLVKEGQLNES